MAATDVAQSGNKVMQSINYGINTGLLTATNIAAADTVANLVAAVDGNTTPTATVSAEAINNRGRVSRAITLGATLGYFTDAGILSLTTTAGLQALLTGISVTQGPILLLE